MGLDMYLYKAKRIGDVTAEQLVVTNNYFSYLEKPKEYSKSTMEEWCGITEDRVDMSVVGKYKDEFIVRFPSWDKEKKYGWNSIYESIASWRKANHIHNWFVENIQDGEDDCGMYEVSKEQLEELLDICKTVVSASTLVKGKVVDGQRIENGEWVNIYIDGEYIEDYTVAKELLPTVSGFFFGSEEYDQWYIEDTKYTIEIIEKVLNDIDFDNEIIMYHSSW